MLRRAPVVRTRRGDFRLRLSTEERALLRGLPGQLRELLESDDASLRRLFPPAYTENPDFDAEYRRLMRSELVARRLESIGVVESTLDAERVNEDQLVAWMKVVNDLRLVFGTQLDVSEDEDPTHLDPADPQAQLRVTYWFLSYLLEAAVEALSSEGPPDPSPPVP